MPRVKKAPVFHIFCILIIYLFFFLLKSPVIATNAVSNALNLCYAKVIPSIFPFLVLSDIIVSSHIAEDFGNIFGNSLSKIFRIKKIATTSFILGCLFGFPLGTKTVVSLYEKNYITKEETERLICFCSNTGPAFVLGMVGSVINNKKIAVCIYLCQVISAFFIGIILRKKTSDNNKPKKQHLPPFSLVCIPNAITSSVFPMLNICAFVCFFSCVSASVENILIQFTTNEYAQILITGFLEITNGISKFQNCQINNYTVFSSAFFVGWSGISVILQSVNITSKYDIDCKKFVISKFLQGVICGFLTLFVCKLLKIC